MPIDILSPPGRIVWGHPIEGRQKRDDNDNVVLDAEGKPVVQWNFGLAIDKNDPNIANELANFWAALQQEAGSIFPNGLPEGFSWKFKDGDSPAERDKEGRPGHWIFAISTSLAAPPCDKSVNGGWVPHTEIKCGDYVRAHLTIKAHAGKPGVRGSKSGLYLNPNRIMFLGYGSEIVNTGVGAETAYANAGNYVPAGASATPIGGSPQTAPPAATAPAGAPPMAQPPQVPGQMPPAAPVAAPPVGQPPTHGAPAATAPAGAPPTAPVAAPEQSTAYPGSPQAQPPAAPVAAPPPAHDFVQNAVGGQIPGQMPPVGIPGQGGQ